MLDFISIFESLLLYTYTDCTQFRIVRWYHEFHDNNIIYKYLVSSYIHRQRHTCDVEMLTKITNKRNENIIEYVCCVWFKLKPFIQYMLFYTQKFLVFYFIYILIFVTHTRTFIEIKLYMVLGTRIYCPDFKYTSHNKMKSIFKCFLVAIVGSS